MSHSRTRMDRRRPVALAATVSVVLFAITGGLRADEGHETTPLLESLRPTPLPGRIILTWTGDPAHTQNITWRTDTSVTQSFAEFAVAQPGPSFVNHTLRVPAEIASFSSDGGECHYHSVRLAGLTPSTKYVYRVGDGANMSEWFHFTSASDQPEPFRFIYFGDAQNDVRSHWSRVIREAHADAPRASFMLHAGDLINVPDADAEWGEWFGAGAWLNAMIPSIATPGNHEYARGPNRTRRLSHHWRPQFAFPENGPAGLEETVYWLDFQGVRIVSLNSNEQVEPQTEWLDRVLSRHSNRWTIVTFHHPVFSTARGRDNPHIRAAWKPMLDRHRVDLVLQGHDHTYARTGLEVPENLDTGARVRQGGTVYVVSVSGPKMYDLNPQEHFERTASGAQLYQIIDVGENELRYEARLATGELYDAFTLKKRTGQHNQLIERVPPTPELRKPDP